MDSRRRKQGSEYLISWWILLLLSVGYVALLFAIAYWGDSLESRRYMRFARPAVYSLSLAVYCTSWTFYGAVGTAARSGWGFLPIYLGPILVILFGWPMISRIVAISKRQNLTSIADFIAARYGKARSLAILVTVIATIGSVPYIALQLKAVVSGFDIVSQYSSRGMAEYEMAFIFAAFLAMFAILFGTRQIDATEHHHGMMLAIAFESAVKLLAFAAVGVFAFFLLRGGSVQAINPPTENLFALDRLPDTFVTQLILASAAIFCLPRQFHVAVVEAHEGAENRSARWMFPLYLALFCVFVIPITHAGLQLLPAGEFSGDTFVLALPMQGQYDALTVLAFIGGFSAATGMVIVASVTLSTMISNEIVMPMLLRIRRLGLTERSDLSRILILIRRFAIIAIALFAYIYFRVMDRSAALASTGLLSFAAAAQFAPLIILGLYWPRATRLGAISGLTAGFVLWAYTLLLPTLARAGVLSVDLLVHGPFSINWLRPESLLFDAGANSLTHGVFLSLSVNVLVFVAVSLRSRQSLVEKIQARAFSDSSRDSNRVKSGLPNQEIVNADLRALAERFVGEEHASRSIEDFATAEGIDISPSLPADRRMLQFTERMLAGAIGAASARVVLTTALRKTGMDIGDVVLLLDETSQAIRFNRQLLEATLENISQGVSVIDESQQLIGWNSRYEELMGYPRGLLHVGTPVAELMRYNADKGRLGEDATDKDIAKRVRFMREGSPYRYESSFADGRVIEIRGQPMPDGGFVTTYSDITESKAIETALRDSEKQVRTYTDNAPAMITYIDSNRRFRFANKAYVAYLGLDREEIIGQSITEVLDEGQLLSRSRYLDAAFSGEKQTFELEMSVPEGRGQYTLGTYIPDRSEAGDVIGVYAVLQDITDRRRAEVALVEAKENLEQRVADRTAELHETMTAVELAKAEAEDANASKTRFLAAAAHDLLQPLNAAKLFTALLTESSAGMKDEQRQLVTRIESGLLAVEDLLSALLDISRFDTKAPAVNVEDFPLADLFETLEAQFAPAFADQGLQLRFAKTSLWLRSDPALVRRVVQNFVSNARRYTPSGGVLVGCRRKGDEVALQVYDTGIGIAAEHRAAVFEEFRRLAGSETSAKRGLGLGLAIVERIARLLGHKIQLRSEYGSGSCFEIVVPRAPPGRVQAIDRSVRESHALSTLDGQYVLCVDNQRDILDGMHGLLSRWGAQPILATDLEEASAEMHKLRTDAGIKPAILLVDYHLDNDVTGLEIIVALRSECRTQIPAIILTADHSDDVAAQVAAAEHPILYKPIKPAALRALVTSTIGRREVA